MLSCVALLSYSCVADYAIAHGFRVNKDPAAFNYIDTTKIYVLVSSVNQSDNDYRMPIPYYLKFYPNGRYAKYIHYDSTDNETLHAKNRREQGLFRFEGDKIILQYRWKSAQGGNFFFRPTLVKHGKDTLQIRNGNLIETYRAMTIPPNVIRPKATWKW